MTEYDGLYELRIFYNTTPSGENMMEHVLTIDARITSPPDIGTPFNLIDAKRRDGDTVDLETATLALTDLILAFYETSSSITKAELWEYAAEPSLAATFVSVLAIGTAGDSGSSTKAAAQNTMTLRTIGGGIMRVQMMETVLMDNVKDAFPFSNAAATALANYLLSTSSPFVGRDDTYPIAASYFSQTQNEKLYKKRYR